MDKFIGVLIVLAMVSVFFGSMGYRPRDFSWSNAFSKLQAFGRAMGEAGAVTRLADVDPQVATAWSDKLYIQAEKLTFWQNFQGEEGSGQPIIRKDDLEGGKGKGDTIKTDIVLNLTGAGLTGDTTLLEDNEEKINFRQSEFTVTSLKNAVRWGDLADLFISHDMRKIGQKLLSKWLAGKIDDRTFNEFTGQTGFSTIPTKNKWACGSATTIDDVLDTDTGGRITWDEIVRMKAYAQTELKMEPVAIEGGEEVYGLVLHPYAALSLKVNDTKYQQAQREARERGANNPLFTGAFGMVDNVILYEAQRVPKAANASALQVAHNIFFGAQAMSRGYVRRPVWREQEFSYGEEVGIATIVVYGEKLNIFDLNTVETPADATDDTAIGSMVVYSAAPTPSQP